MLDEHGERNEKNELMGDEDITESVSIKYIRQKY